MAAPDRPGLAAAVFTALGDAHLNVQFIVQSIDLSGESHMQFCIDSEDLERAIELLEPVAEGLGGCVMTHPQPVALVAVFGPDFRQRPGIAGTAFRALADAGINIIAVSTSISTVTCVLAEDRFHDAIAALGDVFDLP
jgi:aspartokinase